ncbi:hypothetical protein [Pseudomonas sp. Sample_23]|uniref:hypothetical protein n=1 Tax=Pseudomonas sp. Sample_23 TaxID=2448267 RepID=UPI0015AA1B27|nr:hypothetical protein [Pseudomonas sp. Sample_23]
MARKTKSIQYVPLEERPEFIAAMAALPTDPAELEVRAERVLQLYHDAMLAADVQALDDAHLVHQACVVKLNGGTSRGCASVQDVLAAKFAAPAGQVPNWGQSGEFLLEVDGMRMVVKMGAGSLANHVGADLYAVDFDKPFISRTGYRHQFMRPAAHVGRTVDQAVRAEVMEASAREGWATTIDQEHGKPKDRKVWPWLADALAGVRPDGQLAMFGDAPKDPNAKKPMSNKERQKAFRERQRKLKEEQGMQAVLLDEEERQLIYRLRELKRKADPIDDPRPFLLTQRDRTYLTSALDYYEFCTYGKWSQEYPKQNLRELYVRLSVHRQYAQETDFPPVEKRMAWEHEQVTKSIWDGLKAQVADLERETCLLEGERNKAHAAIATWENRLRAAGQSTDYRPLPGEQGHVTVTNDKE